MKPDVKVHLSAVWTWKGGGGGVQTLEWHMWVLAACLVTEADSTEKHKIGQLLKCVEGEPETIVLNSQTVGVLLPLQLFFIFFVY